jgi:uncharacterized protein Yka (UPF0111/DUF47 family)
VNFKDIFVVGEKKTFAKLDSIIEEAKKGNSIVAKMFEPEAKGFILSNDDMRLIEKQTDEQAFRLKEEIVDGAINPNVIDNLLDCVDLADSIVDDYYFITRELKRMEKLGRSPDKKAIGVGESFTKLIQLGELALSKVSDLLKTEDISKASDIRKDIELLEEEGDDVKDEVFDKLYDSSDRLDYLLFAHLSGISQKLDQTLDSTEDFSDSIIEIMKSISR